MTRDHEGGDVRQDSRSNVLMPVMLLDDRDQSYLRRPPQAVGSNPGSDFDDQQRSIKNECLSKLILFGETSLRRAVNQFIEHYHFERPHQGKGNQLLFPSPVYPPSTNPPQIQCHERLGGVLKFYQRAA